MNDLQYSANGLALTKQFEGLRLSAYQDGRGIWTIGYGHTGTGVEAGLVITEPIATQLLTEDIASASQTVNGAVKVPINQNQFDALVDFAYNAGEGNFKQSTLLRLINNGDFTSAYYQFGLWVYAGKQVEQGLVQRRKAEASLFRSSVINQTLAA